MWPLLSMMRKKELNKIMEEGLTEWDVEQINRLIHGNKNAGCLVLTKTGMHGRTYSNEVLVGGKVRVYTDNGNFLCDPKTLKLNGYVD